MLLAISPLNKGLMRGAICQSGNAIVLWSMDHTSLESVKFCKTSCLFHDHERTNGRLSSDSALGLSTGFPHRVNPQN